MSRDRAQLSLKAVHALTLPTEPWLSCEDCFVMMDEFAEALIAAVPVPRMIAMTVHLEACTACHEEAESLVRLLASDAGSDPAAALARMHC